MKECDKYLPLISARLDGALSPAETAELEAHLAVCPRCRALADDLAAIHNALAGLPAGEPPAGLTGRILAAIGADNVTPLPVKKAHPWKKWAAMAAALAVALLGVWEMARAGRGGDGGQLIAAADLPLPAPEAVPNEDSLIESKLLLPRSSDCSGEALPGAENTADAAGIPQEQGSDALTLYGENGSAFPAAPPQPALYSAALPSADKAADALTPGAALELLLEKEGLEGYDRVSETEASRLREDGTTENLVYDALSENGKYYIFVLSRIVPDDPDAGTVSHSSRCGAYAVALDGGEILEESGPEFWEQMKN